MWHHKGSDPNKLMQLMLHLSITCMLLSLLALVMNSFISNLTYILKLCDLYKLKRSYGIDTQLIPPSFTKFPKLKAWSSSINTHPMLASFILKEDHCDTTSLSKNTTKRAFLHSIDCIIDHKTNLLESGIP